MSRDESDQRTPVERTVKRSFLDETMEGGPLSRRARQTRRSVEDYLRGGVMPSYMRRLKNIERELQRHRRKLDRAHGLLSESVGHDPELFAELWHRQAREWRFEHVNELIRDHNEWYPVERNLPLDPRTRDYVKIAGRSYRRAEIGADWVLEHYPPVPRAAE